MRHMIYEIVLLLIRGSLVRAQEEELSLTPRHFGEDFFITIS